MIKEYQILSDFATEDLVKKVNNAITQGWQPVGGVSVTKVYPIIKGEPLAGQLKFVQSVVR